MAYSHSFSPEFYGTPYECGPCDRPTNVCDALASMPQKDWDSMAEEVFGTKGDYLDVDTVLSKIIETDTVGDLSTPVSVWIDEEGFWTVDVF